MRNKILEEKATQFFSLRRAKWFFSFNERWSARNISSQCFVLNVHEKVPKVSTIQRRHLSLILSLTIEIELRFYRSRLDLRIDWWNRLANPEKRWTKRENRFVFRFSKVFCVKTRCGIRYSFDNAKLSFSAGNWSSLGRFMFAWWYLNGEDKLETNSLFIRSNRFSYRHDGFIIKPRISRMCRQSSSSLRTHNSKKTIQFW